MESIDLFYKIGIPMLIFFVLMLAVGVILLVVSVSKTVKGKKWIGGIIAGGILTFIGFIMVIYSGMMIAMGGYADMIATSSEASRIQKKITDSIEEKDEDDLVKLIAETSYSGEEIMHQDIEQLFTYIEDYEISSKSIVSTSFHNDIKEVKYKYILKSDDGDKCTIFFYCITRAKDENSEYIGIQYIQLNQGKSVAEYGTIPDLN